MNNELYISFSWFMFLIGLIVKIIPVLQALSFLFACAASLIVIYKELKFINNEKNNNKRFK